MRIRLLLITAGAVLALAAPAGAVEVETIATGLDNPRHLAFGGHNLFVAEAGAGGAGPCMPGPEGGNVCVGDTGAVTVIDRRGNQRRIVEGLASLGDEGTGNAAIGPHGIFVKHGKLYVTNGGPTAANRDELAAANPVADLFGRLLQVKRHGRVKQLVDVWGFERDENPDGGAIDSNAVDVLSDRGRLIIADAGGNALIKAKRNGDAETLSVFPSRLVPNPFGGPDVDMQAVPTGVVKGPHGDYFMTQLTGFPFPVGEASVWRVDRRSGDAEVFASGFTNLMDLAFDRHGNLWVLEIDHDGLLTPDPADGAIFKIDRRGNARQLELPAGTLTHPGGITVGHDGDLYVSNKGDQAGAGEVLKIDLGKRGHGHGHKGHGHHHGDDDHHGGKHRRHDDD